MKQLFFVTILFLVGTLASKAFSQTFNGPKGTSATKRDYSISLIKEVWASDTPACIKNGGKVLEVNEAFRKHPKLKDSNCAASEGAKATHRKLGVEQVIIFKAAFLPQAIYDKVVK